MDSIEASKIIQTKNGIPITVEIIRDKLGTVPALLRVTLPEFSGDALDKETLSEVARCIKSQARKDARIAFVLPDSVKKIKSEAFVGCEEADECKRTYGYTESRSRVKELKEKYTFQANLEQLLFSSKNQLEVIEFDAFRGCRYLDFIGEEGEKGKTTFQHLTSIDNAAFHGCPLKTAPFDANTPLVGFYNPFFGDSINNIIIPKTLEIGCLCEAKTPRTIFIPKNSKLNSFSFEGSSPLKFIIEDGIEPETFSRLLGLLFANVIERRIPDMHCPEVVLQSPKGVIPKYQYEEFSIVRPRDYLLYNPVDMLRQERNKICFSSDLSIEELVNVAYEKYKGQEEAANKDYKVLLNCLSPELVLYALSQSAEKLIKSLEGQEDVLSFIGRSFLLVRFISHTPCCDLYLASSGFDIDAALLRGFFIQRDPRVSEIEMNPESSRIIDIIKEDRLDDFKKWAHSHDLRYLRFEVEELKIPYPSGYLLNYSLPHTPLSMPGSYRVEAFHPIKVAAFSGSARIFKYLVRQYQKQREKLPSDLPYYCYLAGNEKNIQIANEAEPYEMTFQQAEYLSFYFPNRSIAERVNAKYNVLERMLPKEEEDEDENKTK